MSDQLKRNLELEAAIEKEPDNLDTYLVYGDWLQARGDPRGELIALQCAAHRATAEHARDIQRSADALLKQHGDALLGGLADVDHQLEWRFGFIEALRMPGATSTSKEDNIRQGMFLRRFMALPSARFLRRLDLFPVFSDAGDHLLFCSVSESLGMAVYPTLETLALHWRDDGAGSLEDVLVLVRPRFPKESFPRLRSLSICGTVHHFDSLDLPELRELMMFGISPFLLQGQYVASARLPNLERLVLHGHTRSLVALKQDIHLRTLFEARQLPRLKHLELNWSRPFAQPGASVYMCRALARSPLLQQLESLDLSGNELEDDCATVLLERAAAFKHLRHLDLGDNHLSARNQAWVATLCASVNTRPLARGRGGRR